MYGKKGRKPAPLPAYFELRTEDKKIRCKICFAHHTVHHYYEEWIHRTSLKNHEGSIFHKLCIDQETKRQNSAQINHNNGFIPAEIIPLHDIKQIPETSAHSDTKTDMWEAFSSVLAGDTCFEIDMGPEEILQNERQEFEDKLKNLGHWSGLEMLPNDDVDGIENGWDEAAQDEALEEILQNIAPEDDDSDDFPHYSKQNLDAWYPYNSKLMFLLDTIDNLPHLRISGSLMRVFLWILRQVGVKHVPSFDALRKVQHKVRAESGVPTIDWMSPKGNAFSFNDPSVLIANDWMNPLIAPQIRRYPVIPNNGVISEVWHAQKWRHDIDRHVLSPMYDAGQNKHFFIDEPALLRGNKMVIPVRWLEDEKGEIWADAWEVECDKTTKLSMIRDNHIILIKASELEECLLDLEADNKMPSWSLETTSKGHVSRIPNPDRALAEGDPIYTSFIDVFGDDVSGNQSKSWNKHWNIYITHRNLPRKLLNQSVHTHFVSTSPHASVPEQFQGIKDIIEETHRTPVKVRNAADGIQIRFKIYCNCAPGDNPSQSETSGHIGGNGNHPCRKCDLGGSQKERETNDSFHASFGPGNLRSSEDTRQKVEEQLRVACLGVAQSVKDIQTKTGVKDAFTQHWIEELIVRARHMQKLEPLRSTSDIQSELMAWVNANKPAVYNSFLIMPGFDASRDTPVEILHTILLGVVKYIWHGSHTSWMAAQQKLYASRLQATNALGLSIHPIRASYIMQYANSLIGRQLKTLVQVNSFHVYDLISSTQFLLTKAIGELAALLWFPEIRNLDEYLLDVETAVGNVLDIAALVDPSKINSKIKYHLLTHLREDIIRFGPLIGVATEVFECFNAIFRSCSILSNHLAPSRDIAHQLAEQETMKHILSGGWWRVKEGGWGRPGSAVRNYIKTDKVLQTLVGWDLHSATSPAGTVKLLPLPRSNDKKLQPRIALKWRETAGTSALNASDLVDTLCEANSWYRGKHVVAKSEDLCKKDAWIYAHSPFSTTKSEPPITGRIMDILQDTSGRTSLVVIDVFEVGAVRHDLFGMPFLRRQHDEQRVVIVPAKAVLFQYNVQHDCCQAGCTASGRRAIQQERIELRTTEDYIEHKPVDRFIINTHAFHNAHLIRSVLPRDLVAPIPFTIDRRLHHDQIAKSLRSTQESKREQRAAKAAEKRKGTAQQRGGIDPVEAEQPTAEMRGQKRKRGDGTDVNEDDAIGGHLAAA